MDTVLIKKKKAFKIIAPPIKPVHFVLTRYLYIKEDAMVSLLTAILKKDKEQALFWIYELYFSGFKEEMFEFLLAVYRDMFSVKNPRLGKFLQQHYDEWTKDPEDASKIGTIVYNLVDHKREFYFETFFYGEKPAPSGTKDHKFYRIMSPNDVKPYETIHVENESRPRLILPNACKYSAVKNASKIFNCLHKDADLAEIRKALYYNWLFYASYSPVWIERIHAFEGTVDYEKKKVVFEDEDMEEEFYDNFGYEPDEQARTLLEKITHFDPMVQMSVEEYINMVSQ